MCAFLYCEHSKRFVFISINTASVYKRVDTERTITQAHNLSLRLQGRDTLNVGANKRVYMGYRVYYAVEKGTRELYDVVTGEVLRSYSYTVKVPQYGEYKLITY